MEKNLFRKDEVLSYLETSIIDNVATAEEIEFYEDYKWSGQFKMNYTYKLIILNMKKEYEGK